MERLKRQGARFLFLPGFAGAHPGSFVLRRAALLGWTLGLGFAAPLSSEPPALDGNTLRIVGESELDLPYRAGLEVVAFDLFNTKPQANLAGDGGLTVTSEPDGLSRFNRRIVGVRADALSLDALSGRLSLANDVGGRRVTMVATGPRASGRADSSATVIAASETRDFRGRIEVRAEAGSVDLTVQPSGDFSSAQVGAHATGIGTDYYTGGFSGAMDVRALGGTFRIVASDGTRPNFFYAANTNAFGLRATTMAVTDFSGTIRVANRPLQSETKPTLLGSPLTAAVSVSTGRLRFAGDSGRLHASIIPPPGFTKAAMEERFRVFAIQGAGENDRVSLHDFHVVGDIDLGRGENSIILTGDTRVDGDLMAERGSMDTRLGPGRFQPVGTVRFLDLKDDTLQLEDGAQLWLQLGRSDPGKLVAEGAVSGPLGIGLLPPDSASSAREALGGPAVVLEADETDALEAFAAENSFFDFDLTVGEDSVALQATEVNGLFHLVAPSLEASARIVRGLYRSTSHAFNANERRGFFLEGFGTTRSSEGDGEYPGRTRRTGGAVLGYGGAIDTDSRFRVVFGHSQSSTRGEASRYDSRMQHWTGGVGMTQTGFGPLGAWVLDGFLFTGFWEDRITRRDAFGQAFKATPTGAFWGSRLGLKRPIQLGGKATLVPGVSIDWMHQTYRAFEERGSGVGKMAYGESSETRSMLEIGLEAVGGDASEGPFSLRIGMFYRAALEPGRREERIEVLGHDQTVRGPQPVREELVASLAPGLRLSERLRITAALEAALSDNGKALTGRFQLERRF